MTLYELSMAGAFLPMLGIAISARGFRSYGATAAVSAIGLFAASLGVILSLSGTKEAEGMHWNLGALAVVYALVLAYCLFRSKNIEIPVQERLATTQTRLKNTLDVALPTVGCSQPGTCWYCGKSNAPLRKFRLVRVIILPVAVGGESVYSAVPLCAEHSRYIHFVPHWVRMLCGPLLVLLWFLPILILGDNLEKYLHAFKVNLMLLMFILCVGLYVVALRWANRSQRFRLHSIDAKGEIMVVRFENPAVAEAVRNESVP